MATKDDSERDEYGNLDDGETFHGGAASLLAVHPEADSIAITYGRQFFVLSLGDSARECLTQRHAETIRCVEYSPDGKYIGTAGDDKDIKLWNSSSLELVASRRCGKKVTALCFADAGSRLIYADKFGDVEAMDVPDLSSGHSFLLGHYSIVTDVKLSAKGDYLITADRDEKIRVSCFPETWEIEAFCLGHLQFVTKVLPIGPRASDAAATGGSNSLLLLSGSGDGTACLWNYPDGRLLFTYHVASDTATAPAERGKAEAPVCGLARNPLNDDIAVLVEGAKEVYVIRVSADGTALARIGLVTVPSPPSTAVFDTRGRLWVVTDSGSVIAFTPRGGSRAYDVIGGEDDAGIAAVVAVANRQLKAFVESGQESGSLAASQLRKKTYTEEELKNWKKRRRGPEMDGGGHDSVDGAAADEEAL